MWMKQQHRRLRRQQEAPQPQARLKPSKAKAKKGKIDVSWKKYKKASGYIVYRAESKYGVYDEFAVVKKNSFKDNYSVKGRKFYYKVRAFKNKGDGKILSGISKKASVKAK